MTFDTVLVQVFDVISDARRKPPADLHAANAILEALSDLQKRAWPSFEASPIPTTLHQRGALPLWRARKLTAYIDNNRARSLRTPELAALVGLADNSFSRGFRQTFGENVRGYVARRRIELAKTMMLETDHALCEIALATGFSDQAHMTRLFTRLIGESPARWRRARASIGRARQAGGSHHRPVE
jgi:AraC family transcriptional regulator